MTEGEKRPPESPTEMAILFGLPAVGLGEMSGLGESGARNGLLPEALEVIPGQSGAEGLAELPNAREEDPADGP